MTHALLPLLIKPCLAAILNFDFNKIIKLCVIPLCLPYACSTMDFANWQCPFILRCCSKASLDWKPKQQTQHLQGINCRQKTAPDITQQISCLYSCTAIQFSSSDDMPNLFTAWRQKLRRLRVHGIARLPHHIHLPQAG